jgi:hypothetical protein
MDSDSLIKYVRQSGLDDGTWTHNEAREWIWDNREMLLIVAYPGSGELLNDLSDRAYVQVLYDLVMDENGYGLITNHIMENIMMADDDD